MTIGSSGRGGQSGPLFRPLRYERIGGIRMEKTVRRVAPAVLLSIAVSVVLSILATVVARRVFGHPEDQAEDRPADIAGA
jgi:hypothetical protein